jgi:hypothetical protein
MSSYWTLRRQQMVIEEKENVDRFSRNYRAMNDTGKEKLIRVAGDFLDIYNTVNEREPQLEDKNRKEKVDNKS